MLLCTVFCINMQYQRVWTMYIGKTTHWWVAWLLPCCLFFSVASTKEYAKQIRKMLVIIKTGKIQHSILKVAVDCVRITLSRTRTVFAATYCIIYQFIHLVSLSHRQFLSERLHNETNQLHSMNAALNWKVSLVFVQRKHNFSLTTFHHNKRNYTGLKEQNDT